MQAKVRERGLGLRHRLNAGPDCDIWRRWDGICGLRCYMSEPLPLPFIITRPYNMHEYALTLYMRTLYIVANHRLGLLYAADTHRHRATVTGWMWHVHPRLKQHRDISRSIIVQRNSTRPFSKLLPIPVTIGPQTSSFMSHTKSRAWCLKHSDSLMSHSTVDRPIGTKYTMM